MFTKSNTETIIIFSVYNYNTVNIVSLWSLKLFNIHKPCTYICYFHVNKSFLKVKLLFRSVFEAS